jgi:23S rRNA (adenine2030-N6)-methyltransferase
VKDAAAPAFIRAMRRLSIPKILRAELHVAPPAADRLVASGLLLVNPPWRLAGELERLMPALTARLAQSDGARFVVEAVA